MKKQFQNTYNYIISIDNLLNAWREFLRGKRKRKDVQQFERNLMSNILVLHSDLTNKTYSHSLYHAFNISDPKPRNIHKASVRDRLLHHAIYRVLYPFFDKVFIANSYSCRKNKGTHKAMNRFKSFGYKVSKNNTKTCWVLKCDIKKFFASIDQEILLNIIIQYIPDKDIIWLFDKIVKSFYSTKPGKGLPLGNLTSQLLVNVYMNQFDQFMKHDLKIKYYIRYADDFVIFSDNRQWLITMLPIISEFLSKQLSLSLHEKKVSISTVASGVDFLGWVHFSDHRVLRTATKKRMMKRLAVCPTLETKASYLGLLKHGNGFGLKVGVEDW